LELRRLSDTATTEEVKAALLRLADRYDALAAARAARHPPSAQSQ